MGQQTYKNCFEGGYGDALEYASCIIDFVSESYTSDASVPFSGNAMIGRSIMLSLVSDVLRDVADRVSCSPDEKYSEIKTSVTLKKVS